MKTCWVCKQEKPENQFTVSGKKCYACMDVHREMRQRGEFVPTLTRPAPGLKLCSVCKCAKPLNDFYVSKGCFSARCRPCETKGEKELYLDRKRHQTADVKKQAPPTEAAEFYAGWQMRQPIWVDPAWV